jgi:hypothetical protein
MTRHSLSTSFIGCTLAVLLLSPLGSCTSLNHGATTTRGAIHAPPPPPTAVGCYNYKVGLADSRNHEWTTVPCLTAQEKSHLPHLNMGGLNGSTPAISGGVTQQTAGNVETVVGWTAGSVSVMFPGTGKIGSMLAPLPVDSGVGFWSFSLQANTNQFPITCNVTTTPLPGPCVAGHAGAIQFGYQTSMNLTYPNTLCISNDELTTNQYYTACVGVGPPATLGDGSNIWTTGATLQIIGFVTSAHTVGTVFAPPWDCTPNFCTWWAIVTPDWFGLCWDQNPAAAQCPWNQLSGTMLGYGGGSLASFSPGVTLVTSVAVSACSPPPPSVDPFNVLPPVILGIPPYLYAALPCTQLAGTYQGTLGDFVVSSVTEESNNLTLEGTTSPYFREACIEGTCAYQYAASD